MDERFLDSFWSLILGTIPLFFLYGTKALVKINFNSFALTKHCLEKRLTKKKTQKKRKKTHSIIITEKKKN